MIIYNDRERAQIKDNTHILQVTTAESSQNQHQHYLYKEHDCILSLFSRTPPGNLRLLDIIKAVCFRKELETELFWEMTFNSDLILRVFYNLYHVWSNSYRPTLFTESHAVKPRYYDCWDRKRQRFI